MLVNRLSSYQPQVTFGNGNVKKLMIAIDGIEKPLNELTKEELIRLGLAYQTLSGKVAPKPDLLPQQRTEVIKVLKSLLDKTV
jgi:hypothetical protein